jgi:hypothetical protein
MLNCNPPNHFYIFKDSFMRAAVFVRLFFLFHKYKHLPNYFHKLNSAAEAAGKKPKLTKQQENAGKSATAKKAEQKAKKAAKKAAE